MVAYTCGCVSGSMEYPTLMHLLCALLQAAIALGVISLVLAMVVLLFLANILLDVVDATYFCYAMDLDTQAVTRGDIHDIISQVGFLGFKTLYSRFCRSTSSKRVCCAALTAWVAVSFIPQP